MICSTLCRLSTVCPSCPIQELNGCHMQWLSRLRPVLPGWILQGVKTLSMQDICKVLQSRNSATVKCHGNVCGEFHIAGDWLASLFVLLVYFCVETKKFYSLLSRIGTDFSLMCRLFPDRNRPELKVSCFYARKQLLLSACLSHHNSVCPSVCPSHGWISQKRCKLGSPNLHRRLPGRL